MTDAEGAVWGYTYDSAGNVLTKVLPPRYGQTTGDTWTYTYNIKNDVLTETSPLSHMTTYGYDTAGNQTSITDALSHAKTITYDTSGYGLVTRVTDALTHHSDFVYDSNGNLSSIVDGLGHASYMTFDGFGQATYTEDQTGIGVTTAYDALGRVTSITKPGSRVTSFTYDAAGNKLTQTDARGKVDSFVYNDAGWLTSHTDRLSRTVSWGYDKVGNKTTFTDGNSHSTTYAYNGRRQLTSVTYPDTTSESYTYTAAGRELTHNSGGGYVNTNYYDGAGRIYKKTGTGSAGLIDRWYYFDADGRKVQMDDSVGTSYYTYDNANRLTSRAGVSYSYDNANRVTTRTLSGVGATTFSYDNADRMTSMTAPGAAGSETTSFTLDNAGRRLTAIYANLDVETETYDSTTAELTGLVHHTGSSTGSVVASFGYTYDANGRKLTETLGSGPTITYGYDDGGQLTSESKSGTGGYSVSYAYDNAGNRTSKAISGGLTETYSYDSTNKLLTAATSALTRTYGYDALGNCTVVSFSNSTPDINLYPEGAEASFNAVIQWGAYQEDYVFNGVGQRVISRITRPDPVTGNPVQTSTGYAYGDDDIASPELAEFSAVTGNPTDKTVTFQRGINDQFVSQTTSVVSTSSIASKFVKSDGGGSSRLLVDASGSVTDSREYDAFGGVVSGSGTDPMRFGYRAQFNYQSDGTGLMLLGHRFYDPSIGRFLSRDPAQAGYNWYTYCNNDPVNAVDPEGLEDDTVPWYISAIDVYIDKKKDPTGSKTTTEGGSLTVSNGKVDVTFKGEHSTTTTPAGTTGSDTKLEVSIKFPPPKRPKKKD